MGVLPDTNTLSRHDGTSYYGDIITISESPITEGILWVGTDDGNVQLSKDGGETWTNLSDRIPGVPKYTYVSRVIASHFSEGRAYVTLDGHRNDDFKPYVFVTENFGRRWKSIASNLPVGGTVNVIREHHRNENLLFIGTERGAYFSLDRGQTWHKFKKLPMVPVDDIAIHPRENDLIFGTHGRSVWVLDDITPLEQLTDEVLNSKSFLFKVRPAERFQFYSHKGSTGHKIFIAPNPRFGAIITYYLGFNPTKKDTVTLSILDSEGKRIRRLTPTKSMGFNRVAWNLRYQGPARQRAQQAGGRRFSPSGPFVVPGEYTAKLTVNGKSMTTPVQVEMDPRIQVSQQDLIAQRDALLKLSRLSGRVSRTSSKIQSLQTQITALKDYLKKVQFKNKEVIGDIDSLARHLAAVRTKLMGSRTRRNVPSFSRKMRSLQADIGSITAAPTEKQLERLDELPKELTVIEKEMNNIIKEELPKLNKKLNDQEIPFLDAKRRVKQQRSPRRFR